VYRSLSAGPLVQLWILPEMEIGRGPGWLARLTWSDVACRCEVSPKKWIGSEASSPAAEVAVAEQEAVLSQPLAVAGR
jgi:hypothetical protein